MTTSSRRLHESASQTAGPYVHIGCVPNHSGIVGVYPSDLGATMRTVGTKGQHITVTGTVFDGEDAPLRDALIEIWQADADGRYATGGDRGTDNAAFSGWGRTAGDFDTGLWRFETIKPGPVPGPDGRFMAPHITFWIVARGVNIGLQTRMYFPDEADANAADPILALVAPKDRIDTLIASPEADDTYRFDIRLQGSRETVFFDV